MPRRRSTSHAAVQAKCGKRALLPSSATQSHKGDAGYLKGTQADWLPAHFDDKSYKSKRRRYFTGT